MKSAPRLKAGFSYSDRVAPIFDGSIADPALELDVSFDAASNIFSRTHRDEEFDLAEMSMARHFMLSSRGDRRFVGLPIFTSRMFRHHSIYVCRDEISSPLQIAGGRIGLADLGTTTAVWLRGILSDQYGLDLNAITWVTAETEGDEALVERMLKGELDAVISPSELRGKGKVRPLFEDPQSIERRYFAETGIFPIMHMCVLRADIHQACPGLAERIYGLFESAKKCAQRRLGHTDSLVAMVPWLGYASDPLFETQEDLGWSYGVGKNEHGLRTFIRYLNEQRLLAAPVDLDDVFAQTFL